MSELKLLVSGGKVFVYRNAEEIYEAMTKQSTFLLLDMQRVAEEVERLAVVV